MEALGGGGDDVLVEDVAVAIVGDEEGEVEQVWLASGVKSTMSANRMVAFACASAIASGLALSRSAIEAGRISRRSRSDFARSSSSSRLARKLVR